MGLFFNFLLNFFQNDLAFNQSIKSLYLVLSVILGLTVILISRFTPYWFVGLSLISLYSASVFGSKFLFDKYLIYSEEL